MYICQYTHTDSKEWHYQLKQPTPTFPWRKPIPAKARRVKSVAATTLLQGYQYQSPVKTKNKFLCKKTKKSIH